MFCAISGAIPREPVVDHKGNVYEKSLIEKYISEHGRDPEGEIPELISIKKQKLSTPKEPSQTSIPNTLLSLQNEWDAVMLESFEIKKRNFDLQRQLANALYENDAAKRVVARLIKERDEVRDKLAHFEKFSAPVEKPQPAKEQAKSNAATLDQSVIDKMESVYQELYQNRTKKKPSPTLVAAENLSKYTVTKEITSLNTAKEPTINKLNLRNNLILTAGLDGNVNIVDNSAQLVSNVKAHKKSCNNVIWVENKFLSCSDDGTVKLFATETKKPKMLWQMDKGDAVSDITIHPSNDYFICTAGTTWTLNDIENNIELGAVNDSEFNVASFHPDGLIFATGSDAIKIWDVKTHSVAMEFPKHGNISSIAFSENGYHMASSSGNTVKFWDLRKLGDSPTDFYSLDCDEVVSSIRFEHSGKYVGICTGNSLKLLMVKKWTLLSEFNHHQKLLKDFAWGPDGQYLVTAGAERRLCLLSN